MELGLKVLVCETCGLASFFSVRVLAEAHRVFVRCPLCSGAFEPLGEMHLNLDRLADTPSAPAMRESA